MTVANLERIYPIKVYKKCRNVGEHLVIGPFSLIFIEIVLGILGVRLIYQCDKSEILDLSHYQNFLSFPILRDNWLIFIDFSLIQFGLFMDSFVRKEAPCLQA